MKIEDRAVKGIISDEEWLCFFSKFSKLMHLKTRPEVHKHLQKAGRTERKKHHLEVFSSSNECFIII